MNAPTTKPLFVIYVIWHPEFEDGGGIAESIRQHFRRSIDSNLSGGPGLSVVFRCLAAPGHSTPLPIDLNDAETTAIVALIDSNFAGDRTWIGFLTALVEEAEALGLGARVFPVAQHKNALTIGLQEQAIRWHSWKMTSERRVARLIRALSYEFCRMLRHYVEHLKHPMEDEDDLERYLKPVQIFLSHSKHDDEGQPLALAIRNRLHKNSALSSFFDVHDIPAGLRFNKVLLRRVRTSAVLVIHTNSYSSREWCRKEVLEAKRWNVPLVVANSISDSDERGFPYLGNAPIVRLGNGEEDRIDVVIGRLLDEVLKDFVWRCRVELYKSTAADNVVFVPRPPELIVLADLPKGLAHPIIVYPDPPLSAEEERLFEAVAPHVCLRSVNEWLAAGAL